MGAIMRAWRVCVWLALLCVSSQAMGHAGVPEPRSLHAMGEGEWVLGLNIGVIASDDPERFFCEEAFDGGEGWRLIALGPREWVTFGVESIQRTEDGCDFESVAPLFSRPIDIAADVPSGHIGYLSNSNTAPGLWVSLDRGVRFEQVPLEAQPSRWTTLRFVDADTVLATGYDDEPAGAPVVWLIDVNTGEITPQEVSGVTYPYLLDVAGGRVLWMAVEGEDTVAFWGRLDALSEHRLVLEGWPFEGKLAPDGETAWITGTQMSRAVIEWTREGEVASLETRVPDAVSLCVEPLGGQAPLTICTRQVTGECFSPEHGSFDLFHLGEDGEIEPLVDVHSLAGWREECPEGSDVAEQCPAIWALIRSYLRPPTVDPCETPMEADAVEAVEVMEADVVEDAGGSSDIEPPADEGDGDGGCCRQARRGRQGSVGLPWLALVLGGLLWSVGRRKRG